MSIPGAGNPLLLGGAAGGYEIERSLRFNSADSAYLSRTPASAGNRKTWTWSGWVKRSGLAVQQSIFAHYGGTFTQNQIRFLSEDTLEYFIYTGSYPARKLTTQVFRDTSSWYHFVFTWDTSNATASDRMRIYVNGVRISSFSASVDPSLNLDSLINDAVPHTIHNASATFFNGYSADIHFIDGQALDPSSFGEFDTNGIWQPKAYTGTYGTNGFHLDFADNSAATATTLGKDTGPNGNNWTPNNLSVTAGAGNDSLVDSPTNYGTDTGAGGEVRGNYATWNASDPAINMTLNNGNLNTVHGGSTQTRAVGNVYASSGKWYAEFTMVAVNGVQPHVGIHSINLATRTTYVGREAGSFGYSTTGSKYSGDFPFGTSYGATFSVNDIIGVALDLDAGTLVFYKNGVSQGTAFTGISGTFTFAVSANGGSASWVANFGQRPFSYTAPSGFKALCTQNLPAPTITKPSTVMDVALWTGNGSARSITGLGFNPDLVWIKGRSGATDHALYDSVRGATLDLVSNSAAAETTQTQGLTAFNSDGFSLGTLAKVNTNAATYAGWVFDAGSSTVTNTAGTISSQVRANASAGFSVVTGTAPSSAIAFTYGHGLGVKPSLLIFKDRDNGNSWCVHHSSVCTTKDDALFLNGTGGVGAYSNIFGSALPTSSVAGAYVGVTCNASAKFVAYCFAPVAGYSAFGKYTGNGSADGPFVYTGFRPRWLMIKSSSAPYGWVIHDTLREPYNVDDSLIYANTAGAEATDSVSWGIDILSNGFKIRTSAGVVWNNSGSTFIYAAFAEAPFALARAR